MKRYRGLVRIVLFLIAICYNAEAVINLPQNITIPAILVFGDSIVDQGMNNALKTIVKCNFPPYGKDFEGGIPTGRFSNGKTPADIIAKEFGIKELVPAYLDPNLTPQDLTTGVSFASGASGFDPQTAQIVSVLTLSDQLEYFKEYIGKLRAFLGDGTADNILRNCLYLVVSGSDDLANTYFTVGLRRAHYDVDSYANLMVNSATNFIQELYGLGARRIFVFGIPPVGCLPSQRTLAGGVFRVCNEKYNEAAQLVNAKLTRQLDSITQSLPQSIVLYVDIYNPLLDLIQRPKKYGFEVSDRGCCGTGNIEVVILCNKFSGICPDDSKYVFWDSYHPTERAYKVLAGQIIEKYRKKFGG